MASTIKDVAKRAQVAPSTVTRVIQDSPSISQATKERVRRAMVELDYHPNIHARSLSSQKTNVLGLVLPQDSDAFYQNSFFPEIIRGISQIAADHQYLIQLCTGKDKEQRLQVLRDTIMGKRVDGLIFLYGEDDDPLVKLANSLQFPSVVLGKSLSPYVSFVDNDNEAAGFDATTYLLNKGYKRIALMTGRPQLFVTQDRMSGYQKALESHGLPLQNQLIAHADDFTRERGFDMMKHLLDHQSPDGLVVTDTLLAEGALKALGEKGQELPIVSFDSLKPLLKVNAYVDIHTLELGQTAFRTLLQMLEDQANKKTVFYRSLIGHSVVDLEEWPF